MRFKKHADGGTRIATDPAHQVSSFAVDPKALHFAVHDTVVETRGDFPIYRPGDIWKMLQGTVFQR